MTCLRLKGEQQTLLFNEQLELITDLVAAEVGGRHSLYILNTNLIQHEFSLKNNS